MTRSLALLSAAALLAAAAQAQCPQGTTAGLVKWSSGSGYASTFAADDEGITNPPVALPFAFPMPGVTANLDQMWVGSNGEIYLSDSTAGLLQPAGGASFGVDSLAEMRGPALGSPRIVPMGDDQQSSVVAGAVWSVTVDTTSVAGQATVTWVDMRRFGNLTDRFSFTATLFSSGAVQFNYGTGIAGDARFVGISIGNNEGVGPSQDLTTLPTSLATESIIYESFTAGTWDLSGQSVLITPDFTPGIETYAVTSVTPYVAPTCASNTNFGAGCFSYVYDQDDFLQLFLDVPATKLALDGNALQFTLQPNGYAVNWLAGAAAGLYVAPTIAATIVANGDDTTTSWSPSVAVPVPGGGTAATWTVSSNGVLTAAAAGNQGTGFTPTLAATATATGLAWYTWTDHNPSEAGSGKVKREEVGNMLYVTFDGVEHRGGTPTVAPSTFQWQINMTTGDVTMLWTNYSASNATNDVLVGCTLAGTGPTPASRTLSTSTPYTLDSTASPVTLVPMTLSATPPPVINPSTLVTWTANNIVEAQPSSGLYLSTMFLSVNPIPGGFDLTGILSNVAGCNAYIASLDLDLGAQVTLAPTASWSFTFDNVAFAPGNVIAAQAVALFDPSFPLANGANFGYQFSNGVRSETQPQ
ncbi:MAG: hypothetical protein JNL08_20615 [Planctomycetes bacterium]|nr:hypothetical protein [Planctomycetota bacterium]